VVTPRSKFTHYFGTLNPGVIPFFLPSLSFGTAYVRPNVSKNSFPIKSQGRLSITRTISHSAQTFQCPYYGNLNGPKIFELVRQDPSHILSFLDYTVIRRPTYRNQVFFLYQPGSDSNSLISTQKVYCKRNEDIP